MASDAVDASLYLLWSGEDPSKHAAAGVAGADGLREAGAKDTSKRQARRQGDSNLKEAQQKGRNRCNTNPGVAVNAAHAGESRSKAQSQDGSNLQQAGTSYAGPGYSSTAKSVLGAARQARTGLPVAQSAHGLVERAVSGDKLAEENTCSSSNGRLKGPRKAGGAAGAELDSGAPRVITNGSAGGGN
eukprot:5527208-Pleurochrysis_carterae.AAC.1